MSFIFSFQFVLQISLFKNNRFFELFQRLFKISTWSLSIKNQLRYLTIFLPNEGNTTSICVVYKTRTGLRLQENVSEKDFQIRNEIWVIYYRLSIGLTNLILMRDEKSVQLFVYDPQPRSAVKCLSEIAFIHKILCSSISWNVERMNPLTFSINSLSDEDTLYLENVMIDLRSYINNLHTCTSKK